MRFNFNWPISISTLRLMSTYAISLWTKQEWFLNRHFTDGKLEKNQAGSLLLLYNMASRFAVWSYDAHGFGRFTSKRQIQMDINIRYINRVVFWQTRTQVVIDDKDFLKWESFSPNKKQAQLASRVKIKATRQPGIRRFFFKSNEEIESSENGQI